MLAQIKQILGISGTDKDSLLQILIGLVCNEIITYTHNEECLPQLENVIIEMVVYRYNRIGTEGLNSENYSGVAYNYATDYPAAIYNQLKAYRKARML